MNQPTKNSPSLLSQQIRKRNYKTLGTSVINSPMSPLSLINLLWSLDNITDTTQERAHNSRVATHFFQLCCFW